jgi:hypothetical protein
MHRTFLILLFLVPVILSAYGCGREKQSTEPTTTPSAPPVTGPVTVPPSQPSAGGGGPASTVIPSDPEENFKNAVLNADLIVSGNITSLRYEVIKVESANVTPGKYAYTIFTLTVDKVIKGYPNTNEVLIKLPGGYIGEIYQVPIMGYFSISDQVLLTLHREADDVFTVTSPSLVWIRGKTAMSEPELSDVIVRVIRIMRANNIQIALPEAEWPPLIEIAPPARLPDK